jgi:hypothetical protein
MSNEIQIKISSKVDGSGFKDAKRDLHDVETAADKAGNEIARLERGIAGLSGKKVKVDVEIGSQDAFNNFTASDRKIKVGVEPDTRSVKTFMSKFGDLAMTAAGPVSKALGNHVGVTVGAAAGVAAAPVLASAIGSALAAGAGAGVIGAGIALAVAGDKNLQVAGKNAGKTFMDGLKKEAEVLAIPAAAALGVLEDAGGRISKKWGDAFEDIADEVVPFTKDIVAGVERISDAFTNVASESGPALEGLGDTWKLLADGVGDFVETVADGGPQAADNLRLVGGATADLLRYTGATLDSLNKLASNPWVTGPLLSDLRQHYKDTADETGTFATRTEGVTLAMSNAAAAALEERGALEALSTELKAQADPVFGIIKAQDDLKAAQKETAKATKEHGANSAEAEAALQKQAIAALSLEANIGKLGETFDGKMTPAMRATFRAAGLTDGAIDRLEKQFKDAKRAGDAFDGTYKANTSAPGAKGATTDLRALQKIVNNLDGRVVDIAMRITGVTNVSKQAASIRKNYASGGIKGAANGGIRDDLTWVGEEGAELVDLPPGSRVHSAPDSRRMAQQAVDGGGQAGPMVVNVMLDGKVMARALVEPTRALVQRDASGNVQQFYGAAA